jgi:hypothetical protein
MIVNKRTEKLDDINKSKEEWSMAEIDRKI